MPRLIPSIPAVADITAQTTLPAYDSAWPLDVRSAWFRAARQIEWLKKPQSYRDEVINATVEDFLAPA